MLMAANPDAPACDAAPQDLRQRLAGGLAEAAEVFRVQGFGCLGLRMLGCLGFRVEDV